MRTKKFNFIILVVSFCCGLFVFSQEKAAAQQGQKKIPANFCILPEEWELWNKINDYRKSLNLPPISISKSLSFVAKTHARDLFFNHPDQGDCNFHSWSVMGNWKPFCYPADEKKNNSVWDKPRELTPYNSKGYEIVYWENNPVNLDSILPFWRSIDYFNSFLVSTGKWQGKNWMALGIGIYENYASVWFGEINDPEGEPWICGQEPQKKETPEKTVKDSIPVLQKQTAKSHETAKQAPSEPAPWIYYIIVSSQQPKERSGKLSAELISRGYKDSKVLIKDNKVRVSIMEFREKSSADSALREVKKIYKDAWLYRQSKP